VQNYPHKQLVEAITRLDRVPDEPHVFSQWIHAGAHLAFLRDNVHADEVVVCAQSEHGFFVTSAVVSNDQLQHIDHHDLLNWDITHHTVIASYASLGDRSKVWITRGLDHTGTTALEGATQLIFTRTFEGWPGSDRTTYELHQEYAHVNQLHWRPEARAYCRFDADGDLDHGVSVTMRDERTPISLVSFKWEQLEDYLTAANASLVRLFDFTLVRQGSFAGWAHEAPQVVYDSEHLFYHQLVMAGHAAYTRGVQIVQPRYPAAVIFKRMTDGWFGQHDVRFVEFIAYDWRNKSVTSISTDPKATTNYFEADGNTFPFELSPAFFKPAVLSKYKTDRDKYTVGERSISCRAAWYLEGMDVNAAGQVHAYIRDLRRLPYAEQLHWLSYNEAPKGTISDRAVAHDFQGRWVSLLSPLQQLLAIVQRWDAARVVWWTLRDVRLLERVNTPLSTSRDEWADAFMDLAKLVVEGFETKALRAKLEDLRVPYEKTAGTIVLLEKMLNKDTDTDQAQKLVGLRTVQFIRSKAKGHASGHEAEQLARDALIEHETFANHFRHICTQVADELTSIEHILV
jgi:hypothetical protein